jgi:hypothetical protein
VLLLAVPVLGLVLSLAGGLALLSRVGSPRGWPRAVWGVVAASVSALAIHAALIPAGPFVYYDEFLHADATASIAGRGSPHPCCGYEDGRCIEGGPIMWPLATHVAAATGLLGHRDITTVNGAAARAGFNRIASLLTPLAAFAWIFLLIGDAAAAAVAAVVLALWPGALRLQTTGDLSPGATFFLALLLGATECWRLRPGWAGAAATIGLLALTCHARMEMSLVVPWIFWRALWPAAGRRQRLVPLMIATPVIVLPLYWLYRTGAQQQTLGWTNGLHTSLDYLRAHAPGNAAFFLRPNGALPAAAVLALIGLLTLTGLRLLPLAATVVALFTFDSAYHIGMFRPNDGPDGFRYTLPIVLLALPFVAAAMHAWFPENPGRMRTISYVVVVLVLVGPLVPQRRFLSAVRQVEPLDEMITRYKPRGSWSPADIIVTRSVAFSRAMTGAPNIIERCSVDHAEDFIHRHGGRAHYLRSWGDGGPTKLKGLCATAALPAERSPDGKGAWLFDYGSCPLFEQLGR